MESKKKFSNANDSILVWLNCKILFQYVRDAGALKKLTILEQENIIADNYLNISSVNIQIICGYILKIRILNSSKPRCMGGAIVVYSRIFQRKALQCPRMIRKYALFAYVFVVTLMI